MVDLDEWVTGKQLIDTEVLITTLCRFSGLPVSHQEPCGMRENLQHPDVECKTLYFQADAVAAGTLPDLDGFDKIEEEIRQPWQGGTPIGSAHRS